jgi:hypothetical protein
LANPAIACTVRDNPRNDSIGQEKEMTGLKPLHVLAILSILVATQTRAQGIYGDVAAACVTSQGPGVCGEPMWPYGSVGDHVGRKSALSPELNAPQADDADKPRMGWPTNMILG